MTIAHRQADDDVARDDSAWECGRAHNRQADIYAPDIYAPDIYAAVHADPDLSLPPRREPAGALQWLLQAVRGGR